MDRFCPACGAQRADGSSFCSECGQRFEATAVAAEPPGAASPEPPAAVAAPPNPAAPPAPQPGPIDPPPFVPQAAYAAPPPQPAPGRSGVPRIVFVLIGLVMIGLGTWKVLDAFHVFGGGQSSYSSSYSPSYAPSSSRSASTGSLAGGPITEGWLQGTWILAGGAGCDNWIRFNGSDHVFATNRGRGTYSLRTWGTATGELTTTMNDDPPAYNNVSRLDGDVLSYGGRNWTRGFC